VAAADTASIQVGNGIVKFYFSSGSADLAPGAAQALAQVAQAAREGRAVLVSGYHDASGDPALNAELAKQRALRVAAALAQVGVAQDQIMLAKPIQTQADGPPAEARRVEVTLQ
jgi:K(+)-stimulated pyrophosphate-energized sodium pump